MKKKVLVGKITRLLEKGNEVVIRNDLVEHDEYSMINTQYREVVVKEMTQLQQTLVKIDLATQFGYRIQDNDLDSSVAGYWWTDEMFLGVALTTEEQVRQYLKPGAIISSVSGATFIVINSNECIKITPGILEGKPINLKNLMLLECVSITYGEEVLVQSVHIDQNEPGIDWASLAVDTPIFVKRSVHDEWKPRHFFKQAEHNKGVYCFDDGRTSFTEKQTVLWRYAKLSDNI